MCRESSRAGISGECGEVGGVELELEAEARSVNNIGLDFDFAPLGLCMHFVTDIKSRPLDIPEVSLDFSWALLSRYTYTSRYPPGQGAKLALVRR